MPYDCALSDVLLQQCVATVAARYSACVAVPTPHIIEKRLSHCFVHASVLWNSMRTATAAHG
jgi:hypothetical protein